MKIKNIIVEILILLLLLVMFFEMNNQYKKNKERHINDITAYMEDNYSQTTELIGRELLSEYLYEIGKEELIKIYNGVNKSDIMKST